MMNNAVTTRVALISATALPFVMLTPSVALSAPECTALLQGGLFDKDSSASSNLALAFQAAKQCEQNDDTFNAASQLGMVVDSLPIQLGLSFNNSNAHKSCSAKQSSSDQWQQNYKSSYRASKIVADAFDECEKLMSEHTIIWTERVLGTRSFIINVEAEYKNPRYPDSHFSFTFAPPEAVPTCTGKYSKKQLREGVTVKNHSTFQADCSLANIDSSVRVVVNGDPADIKDANILPIFVPPIFLAGNISTPDADNPVQLPKTDGVELAAPGKTADRYGADTLMNGPIPPKSRRPSATWELKNVIPGRYQVWITYADLAGDSRPLSLKVNGHIQIDGFAYQPTSSGLATDGGPNDAWSPYSRRTFLAVTPDKNSTGIIELQQGDQSITVETAGNNPSWPHVKELQLSFLGSK